MAHRPPLFAADKQKTRLIHNLFSKKVLTNVRNGYNISNVISTRKGRVLIDEKDGGKDVRRKAGGYLSSYNR